MDQDHICIEVPYNETSIEKTVPHKENWRNLPEKPHNGKPIVKMAISPKSKYSYI
jgi:hypothetical protein